MEVNARHCVGVEARAGAFVVKPGPSRSGKSTFLDIIRGLDRPSGGDFWFQDHDLASRPRRLRLSTHLEGLLMTTLVFDVGNVLIRWDPRFLYERMFPGDPERMEWFLDTICTSAWNLEMDRGASFADQVADLVSRHPEWEAHIRAFDTGWHDMVPGDIPENVALLEAALATGEPVYAITNFSREKWADAQARFPVLTRFTGVVVSAHERLVKPDPAIYRVLLERNGLAAGDCLFIDDSEKNVAGARAVGMRALHCPPGFDLAAGLAAEGVRF